MELLFVLLTSIVITVLIYDICHYKKPITNEPVVTPDTLSENLNARPSRLISESIFESHNSRPSRFVTMPTPMGYRTTTDRIDSSSFDEYFEQYIQQSFQCQPYYTRTIKCKNKHLN